MTTLSDVTNPLLVLPNELTGSQGKEKAVMSVIGDSAFRSFLSIILFKEAQSTTAGELSARLAFLCSKDEMQALCPDFKGRNEASNRTVTEIVEAIIGMTVINEGFDSAFKIFKPVLTEYVTKRGSVGMKYTINSLFD